nr:SGNH/GDSL hydrolase family protein [Streptomyces oceani]
MALFLTGALTLGACTSEPAENEDQRPDARRAPDSRSPSPTPVWDTRPDSIAAVGDSITRGFDACSVLSDCPEVSWATGSDPATNSLAERLLDKPDQHSWNLARSGSRMSDLPEQMRAAAKHDPDMVTVMSGGNDACQDTADEMTEVTDFRTDFTKALRTLRRTQPGTQVYVVSVPDLKRLWSVGRKNGLGRQVWKLGICPSMLRDASSMSQAAVERRNTVRERVTQYNQVLEKVCAEDLRCRYDDGAVFDYDFNGDELSKWDWFHPSKKGQRVLAELAYRHVTAPAGS